MKQFLAAMALTSVISLSTFAGEIPTSGVTAPPPPPATPTATGEIPSGGYAQEMSEAALDLVEWVFSAVM